MGKVHAVQEQDVRAAGWVGLLDGQLSPSQDALREGRAVGSDAVRISCHEID